MPPNRKSELNADEIPTLNVHQLKQHLAATPVVNHNSSSNRKSEDLNDYWSWPTDATVEALEEIAKIADLLSAAHIEQNLVHAAALQQREQACIYNKNDKTAQSYWDEPARAPKESEVPAALYRHLNQPRTAAFAATSTIEPRSYWDWPTKHTAEEAGLQRVLEGQRARHLTTAATYETQLQHHVAPSAQEQRAKLVAAHDTYWVC